MNSSLHVLYCSTYNKVPPLKLSSNFSSVKAAIAIFQVLYGSWELYVARGTQLETYGYAAYSFTVVPYVAMSLLNLLATLCRPRYSHVYLVRYADSESEEEESTSSREVKKELNSLMLCAVGGYLSQDKQLKRRRQLPRSPREG